MKTQNITLKEVALALAAGGDENSWTPLDALVQRASGLPEGQNCFETRGFDPDWREALNSGDAKTVLATLREIRKTFSN